MRHHSNEWISISDLMAGVVAVIMLILIVAIVQAKGVEIKAKQTEIKAKEKENEAAKIERKAQIMMADATKAMAHSNTSQTAYAKDKAELTKILTNFNDFISSNGATDRIRVDVLQDKIILKDQTFKIRSACPEAKNFKFKDIAEQLSRFFNINNEGLVYIEGHTDNVPVGSPSLDKKGNCAVYDDNFILSAARARNIREELIKEIPQEFHTRIVVAGYGDSALLEGIEGNDGRNRRVEIRFSIRKGTAEK